MKHLYETFTDTEHADMQPGKTYIKGSWHDIIYLALTNTDCVKILRARLPRKEEVKTE